MTASPTDRDLLCPRVLIVEDTPTVAALMQAGLLHAGMPIEIAATGAEALARMDSYRPDIVLVDLGLPDMDGFALVAEIAERGDCGVIVVTANGEEAARVAGLETGADDYVVKPVRMRELVARVRALHRRMQRPVEKRGGFITVDHAARCLLGAADAPTPLTEAELAALETLLEAEGTSVSRDWIGRVALRRTLHAEDRGVDQLVLKLRRKLAAQGAPSRTILSSRGQGYIISDPTLFRQAFAVPGNGQDADH